MSSAFALDVYVSPNGDDSAYGTLSQPLQTPHAARDVARESGKLGKEPVNIIFLEGTYRMAEPLTLTPEDRGAKGAEVTYRAADGAEVTLTGALRVELDWEPYRDGIFKAKLSSDETIDQLFVNEQRQRMARYPNYTGAKDVAFQGSSQDGWDHKGRGWKNPKGAYLHAIHGRRWGGTHYEVIGLRDGEFEMVGGYQDNRATGPHKRMRMAENVFEELDAPSEWFYNLEEQTLYFLPPEDLDLATAKVDVVYDLRHLIEIYGDLLDPMPTMTVEDPGNGMDSITFDTPVTTKPAAHISIKGFRLTGTARTFMETKEPLLRSDWTVYRGGAVHLRGTENITIDGNFFDQLGGNAVFIDGYNRDSVIRSNRFDRNGASDVNVIGSPAAVRNPVFGYEPPPPALETIDPEPGPKTDEYPADILIEDNLMGWCGRVEKQPAGVNVAMAMRITIRHNTIHHTPRAGINFCSGHWGGHILEWNDVFETVLETHDHGAFNSWGRDRYWHSATPKGARDPESLARYREKHPDIMLWDAVETVFIRNNRMHCDHGWDIDLDDGSTNYEIYNNLCLSGGIKTREGFYRSVYNNILLGGVYTCNVPYPAPTNDRFERNILVEANYSARNADIWAGVLDNNLFFEAETEARPHTDLQKRTGQDANTLIGDALFIDPDNGNYRVKPESPALKLDFENFPMTGFGVTSAHLKAIAPQPTVPNVEDVGKKNKNAVNDSSRPRIQKAFGAVVDDLDTLYEMSGYGAPDESGVILIKVPRRKSELAPYGFRTDDVVLSINGEETKDIATFIKQLEKSGSYSVLILRGQIEKTLTFER